MLLFLGCLSWGFSQVNNPWGDLKKIYFYQAAADEESVRQVLAAMRIERVQRIEQREIGRHLLKFGDHYLSAGKKEMAEAFYRKVVDLSPEYWHIYNKLQSLDKGRGSGFFGMDMAFKQFLLALKDFKSSFLIMNNFFNVLFFSGILVFFIFSMTIFVRYFRLAGNDLLMGLRDRALFSHALFLVGVLVWPLLALSGFLVYPFLIVGFLWAYLNENEKKTVALSMIVLVIFSLLYSLNLALEKNVRGKRFQVIQHVYEGKLLDREQYERFDNELKVMQAYAYYDSNQVDVALDLLNSTGERYASVLKFDLLGNIYFQLDDIQESIKYFKDSLSLDEKNPVTLNNFTLALLKNNNPKVFSSWARRYPELDVLKGLDLVLREVKPDTGILWRRAFHFSKEKFDLKLFLKNISREFFRLPLLYYMLIFFAYLFLIGRFYPSLGGSTYCAKCSKIIKEASVHKSYRFCDECYQLFLLKDVIFLEAKMIKEKDLKRKFKKKYLLSLAISLLIPGLRLKNRNRDRLFVSLAFLFYLVLGFSFIGMAVFGRIFHTYPLLFNLGVVFALFVYFLANLVSILGEENGV